MYLSGVELYFAENAGENTRKIEIFGDEFGHITRVMRHNQGDEIYITNGRGYIYQAKIDDIFKDHLTSDIVNSYHYENKLENVCFCIPKIKSADRFEFALEKCVELGITKFIIFESERTYKRGEKTERWQKIVISAMKQSLLSYLPSISCVGSFKDLLKHEGEKVILEQESEKEFSTITLDKDKLYYFIFGPEGGLTSSELNMLSNAHKYKLTQNRLRSETAVITCAALLNSYENI
jgi:16S rRNA (uracil1498-N3)-methyltransferase